LFCVLLLRNKCLGTLYVLLQMIYCFIRMLQNFMILININFSLLNLIRQILAKCTSTQQFLYFTKNKWQVFSREIWFFFFSICIIIQRKMFHGNSFIREYNILWSYSPTLSLFLIFLSSPLHFKDVIF
jgi:hypothetical protein